MRDNKENIDNVMYIYDKVSTKANKEREILREYGYEIRKYQNSAAKSMNDRPFGRDFAEAQMRRARPHRNESDGRTIRTDNTQFVYRPKSVPHSSSGQAEATARPRPLKLAIDKIINLFESIEERGRNDENFAKQRAIMQKKWQNNKQNIVTAIILAAITVFVVTVIYKVCFVVRDVEVYGAERYSQDEVANATGINIGDNLYSFKASDVENEVTFKCPYIKNADVTRSIPETVNLVIEEDEAVYYANVWGDILTLSSSLRVLDVVAPEDLDTAKLIKLVIPAVSYSVAGRTIEFADSKSEKIVRSVLDSVMNSTAGKSGEITEVNVTDEYNITMRAENIYSLRLGADSDLDLKLRMFHKTISSGGLENGAPATIDLTKVGEASVKYDLN